MVLVLMSSPGLGTPVQPPLGAPQSRSSTGSSKSTNSPVVGQVLVSPRGRAWTNALVAVVAELDTGRVYDRDLPDLADALGQVLNALDRRPGLPQNLRR